MLRPKSYSVLLVEDETLLRATLAEYLTEMGYRVLQAATGEEAQALLVSQTPIDLLATDINLPGSLSGEDLARDLHARSPDFPVILTSALGRHRLLKGSRQRFVAKPYSFEQMAELIRQLLAGSSR